MDQERAVSDLAPLNLAPTLAGPTAGKGCAADALDELVSTQSIAEAVGTLAQLHWDDDARVLDAVQGASSLQHDARPTRRVGVYYHALGTGGAERVTLDLLELWTSMGLEVTLLCDEGSEVPVSVERLGIATVFLPGFETAVRDAYPVRARALYQALCDHALDALVYSQWLSPTVAWDLLVTKLAGVAFVAFTHGTYRILSAYDQPQLLRVASVLSHARAIVCLSREDERFWRTFHPRVHRTINPIDPAFLAAPAAGLDGHTLMWVGRLDGDKQPLAALEVFAQVRTSVDDARLVMVGPWGNIARDEFERMEQSLGIQGSVEYVGDVAHDRLPQMLEDADVFLLTSRYEGYCLALGEAKALGVPCATYDLDNLELLEGHRGVAVAPVGDVSVLAAHVVELLQDADLRKRQGAEAREHMRELAAFDAKALWSEVFASCEAAAATSDANPIAWLLADASLRAQTVMAQRDEAVRAREAAERERDAVRADLAALAGSVSFKVGRAVTAPLRFVRDRMGQGRS